MRWLTLLVSLPPTPTRHRVGVWRKLKRMGAVKLKGAAWILPETPETIELFQWLAQEQHRSPRETATVLASRVRTASGDWFARILYTDSARPNYGRVWGRP